HAPEPGQEGQRQAQGQRRLQRGGGRREDPQAERDRQVDGQQAEQQQGGGGLALEDVGRHLQRRGPYPRQQAEEVERRQAEAGGRDQADRVGEAQGQRGAGRARPGGAQD